MSPDELAFIAVELNNAVKRGLKVVIITSLHENEKASGTFEKGLSMEGVVLYHNEKQPGQIRIIADTSYVITGEITGDENSTCLYSKNKNLIHLIKDSLTNEIELIKMREKRK